MTNQYFVRLEALKSDSQFSNMLSLLVYYCNIVIVVHYIALCECREVESKNITGYCPGESFTLQCCVNSSATATVWQGSSFDCPQANNEITFTHRDDNASQPGNVKECISNVVKAHATIESTENDIYISKLNVTVFTFNTSLQRITFTCQIDNGERSENVSIYNIDVMSCVNDSDSTTGSTFDNVPSGKGNNKTCNYIFILLYNYIICCV